MATRSRIGIELDNGSILSVYLHFDGYPKCSGRILKTYYDTQRKVSSLINGGDISCLWTNLGFNQETKLVHFTILSVGRIVLLAWMTILMIIFLMEKNMHIFSGMMNGFVGS